MFLVVKLILEMGKVRRHPLDWDWILQFLRSCLFLTFFPPELCQYHHKLFLHHLLYCLHRYLLHQFLQFRLFLHQQIRFPPHQNLKGWKRCILEGTPIRLHELLITIFWRISNWNFPNAWLMSPHFYNPISCRTILDPPISMIQHLIFSQVITHLHVDS